MILFNELKKEYMMNFIRNTIIAYAEKNENR